MKVLVLAEHNIFEQSNAAANRQRSLLENLEKSGNQIFHFSEVESSLVQQRSGLANRFSQIFTLLKELAGRYSRKKELYNFIDKIEPEIIWLAGDYVSTRCLLAKHDISRYCLFIEQSEFLDIHRIHKTNFLRTYLLDRKQKYFENIVLRKLDGLALMTKKLMAHYSNNFPIQVPLLHLPMTVDLVRFVDPGTKPAELETPYISFTGFMNNIKDGVDILIAAFAKISDSFPDHKLYLIGPWQPDSIGHENQIKSLNLQDRVFWLGTYPREAIPGILKNSDLLVLARPNSKQAEGGFPTKLGEYLASSVPVCATSVGEIPDYLEDEKTVFFAEPDSIDSFSNAMKRALSNKQLAAQVGAHGRLVAEREFNAEIQSQKLHEYFEKTIEIKNHKK